ncbi:hypothetical protein HanIR_Chr12g0585571 [Helianthus annuus]|nr:hypothetical protein HanIR_Chr12g0585571 [Helianthus annuus]
MVSNVSSWITSTPIAITANAKNMRLIPHELVLFLVVLVIESLAKLAIEKSGLV